MTNETIAQTAIALIKTGIEYKNKDRLFTAIDLAEDENFSWDNLDALFDEWDSLIDKANDIIYGVNN